MMYVVQEYEKLLGYRIKKGKQVSNSLLYKEELIKIPKPEFFVLYNGTKDLTNVAEDGTITIVTEKMMKLSDAFIENNENENSLELCVKLIDVRYKSNHQSLHQNLQPSREAEENLSILGEYSYFINKVEEYKKQNNSLEDAIKAAAKHCIEKGILRDFLLKNETEVVVMLLGTYNEEIEKQVIREEAEARERAKGEVRIARERAKGVKTLIDALLDFGHSNEEILLTLQKKLGVTEQQANEYLKRFYNKTL